MQLGCVLRECPPKNDLERERVSVKELSLQIGIRVRVRLGLGFDEYYSVRN